MSPPLPNILLLEPQFVLRRTIAMVAKDLGRVEFHEASSAGRARTLLAGAAYAGLVLDAQEGAPVQALLRELRQGRFATPADAPVLLLGADGLDGGGAPWQALGVHGVLDKPVRIAALLDALDQALAPGGAAV